MFKVGDRVSRLRLPLREIRIGDMGTVTRVSKSYRSAGPWNLHITLDKKTSHPDKAEWHAENWGLEDDSHEMVFDL